MSKILSSGRSGGGLVSSNRSSARPSRPRAISPSSNNRIKSGPSKIHGNGIIATKHIPAGTSVGITHQLNNNKWSMLSTGNYNHSSNPNAVIVKHSTHKTMVIKDKVQPGEEITVDYTQQPDLEQPSQF